MDSKKGELLPWEEEEKKKPKRPHSIPPKTSITSKVHSKPKIEGQEYLDLYSMTKEKARLEKVGETMGKAQKQIAENWRKVTEEIADVEGKLKPKADVATRNKNEAKQAKKRIPNKPLKTIPIDY